MRRLLLIGCILLCIGCENTTYKSAVPTRPVQLAIDTRAGMYVHFVPTNTCSYVVVDATGYHFNGQTMPLIETDYYGYAGVVIFVNNNQHYSAFDLCCPHCLSQHQPCIMDGIFAVCPICGEQYDLSFGYATPSKGISREALRKYTCLYSNYRLTVRN